MAELYLFRQHRLGDLASFCEVTTAVPWVKRIGHRKTLRRLLQTIVANRLRGRDCRFDVARLQELIFALGIGGPYAGEAIGHELDPHRQIIRLSLVRGG